MLDAEPKGRQRHGAATYAINDDPDFDDFVNLRGAGVRGWRDHRAAAAATEAATQFDLREATWATKDTGSLKNKIEDLEDLGECAAAPASPMLRDRCIRAKKS